METRSLFVRQQATCLLIHHKLCIAARAGRRPAPPGRTCTTNMSVLRVAYKLCWHTKFAVDLTQINSVGCIKKRATPAEAMIICVRRWIKTAFRIRRRICFYGILSPLDVAAHTHSIDGFFADVGVGLLSGFCTVPRQYAHQVRQTVGHPKRRQVTFCLEVVDSFKAMVKTRIFDRYRL